MKNLRHFCAASVLTLMLTLNAFAGEIDTGIAPPTIHTSATTQGEIETPLVAGDISTPKSTGTTIGATVADAALSLLQSVLSLF